MNKCCGCGVVLQDRAKDGLGYTRDMGSLLCERCFRLRHYGEYKSVSLNNLDYRKILEQIPCDSLVLYVVDILSLDLSFLDSFQKVLLVITKRDIMPKSLVDEKIRSYFLKRYDNLVDVCLVSSVRNYQMDLLYKEILTYSGGQKVYLVGYTNSGKSTLVNQFIHDYLDTDHLMTTSMYPSTTLNEVEICFPDFTLVDTPGLLDKGNLVSILDKRGLKMVSPRREIRPKSCQVEGKGSILLGSYVRLNYEVKGRSSFIIYVSNEVPVRFCGLDKNTYLDYPHCCYQVHLGEDIVIPGLGFIKFRGDFQITLYLIDGVEARVRESFI